jgi:hypothetical protein
MNRKTLPVLDAGFGIWVVVRFRRERSFDRSYRRKNVGTDGNPFQDSKTYHYSFRMVGIFQEGVTKRIYADLKKSLETNRLKVTTIYNTRGGFDTTCVEGTL